MKRYELIFRSLQSGKTPDEVAREFGITRDSVHSAAYYARDPDRARKKNRDSCERARRRQGMASREQQKEQTAKRYEPIIAAVDAGLTYAAVARKFGLKSRNVVAGIVSRRPESRGLER